jgi:hypothetical protein
MNQACGHTNDLSSADRVMDRITAALLANWRSSSAYRSGEERQPGAERGQR